MSAHPHPGGPLAALQDAGAAMALMAMVAEAGSAVRAGELAAGRAASWAVVIRAAADPGLGEVWDEASDGGRRDALTGVAELCARAGVDPAGLEPLDVCDGADDDPLMRQAGIYARDLVGLAVGELAAAGRERDRSLLPEAPWLLATGPTGIYAMSTVCDSSEPDDAKLTAAVAMAAAAQPAAAKGGGS